MSWLARSQRRRLPSTPPEARVARSSEKEIEVTQPRCPSRMAIFCALVTPGGNSTALLRLRVGTGVLALAALADSGIGVEDCGGRAVGTAAGVALGGFGGAA